MKKALTLLATVAALAFSATPSQAALVTITNTSVTPGVYEIDGTLASQAAATFEFSVAGANPASATYTGYAATIAPAGVTTMPYSLGTAYTTGSFGSAPSTQSSIGFFYPTGTNSPSPVALGSPLVTATASLIDASHELVTFTNLGSLTAGFQAILDFNRFTQIGSVQLLSVASVPLPAGLPLFLAGLVALAGFGFARKARVG